MTLQVKMEMLLANDKWERQLQATQKKLKGFEKTTKQISGAIKTAWVAVAALGFNVLGDAIVDATKAAAADNRSQALLDKQLQKNWKTNVEGTKAIEDQIDALANMSGIQDDKLRPALQKIVGVTKNANKGMKAFTLAMDVSAGTGKDLNVVSQAMAKFLGGNKHAFDKLIPGIKNAGDKMKFLRDQYGGMAAISGSNDPFARINVVLDNFKEKIGKAFLPLTNQFADWLAGPDAQKAMDDLAKWVGDTFAWFQSDEGKAQMAEWYDNAKNLVTELIYVVDKFAEFLGMINGDRGKATGPATNIYTGSTVKTTGFGDSSVTNELHNIVYGAIKDLKLDPVSSLKAIPLGGGVTVNVDVKSDPITGKSIVKVLKQEAGSRGTTVGKVLG